MKMKWLRQLLKPILGNPIFYIGLILLCGISVIFVKYGGCSRSMAALELFSDVYLVCLVVMLFPSSWRKSVKTIVFAFLFITGFTDMLCYELMGVPLIPSIVITWLQTNGQEAAEAVRAYSSPRLLLTPLSLFLLLLVLIYWLRKIRFTIHFPIAAILFVITVASTVMSFSNKQYLHYIYTRTSDDDMKEPCRVETMTREYLPVYRLLLSFKEISRLKNMRQQLLDNARSTVVDSCSFRSPLIVLVIGESYNRHHASLYGYDKPTTPLQDGRFQNGSLYRFNDVIASYNLTYKAFQNMLTLYDYDKPDDCWYDDPLIPVLFRKAGYEVDFFSNQYCLEKRAAFSDFIEDSFINNLELSPMLFDHRNAMPHQYDIGLLDDYHNLEATHNPRLIIFHFISIHTDFCMRYPPDWQLFKSSDYDIDYLSDNQKQTIADYDNAIRYNDFVVDSIINTFKNDEAVIIYVPDHGELVYDHGTDFGRNLQLIKEYVKPQYDIPFWIHCTQSYQALHPKLCQQIAASVDRPFMTDDMPHLLLYLAGISIPEYQACRNLIDNDYDVHRKRLIRGEVDYDSICNANQPVEQR